MKRDIRKAVEEIKSAGMEDFLYQDPSNFECDDDCSSKIECNDDCKCPRTRCTHVKHCTFITKCTHVKKWTFVTKCTHVRVKKCGCTRGKKWTFVTKVTHRKECVLVTKCTHVKHCTFVTKCVRFEKKFYWTKRCYCKKCEFFPNGSDTSCDDGNKRNDYNRKHKFPSFQNKKFDHFWYKKRND
ncbi:TPA: spore coat protein G [Bacillus luti]|nr:spore coat protein G [Bacillus luti]HDR7796271.1 spore coat protein G [Bacillus luti]